jgi:hypothetical protein
MKENRTNEDKTDEKFEERAIKDYNREDNVQLPTLLTALP